jgi:hypothetical protein
MSSSDAEVEPMAVRLSAVALGRRESLGGVGTLTEYRPAAFGRGGVETLTES